MFHDRYSHGWRAVGVGCAAAMACSVAAAQVTWHVDDDCIGPGTGTPVNPFCSIQDAIDAALDVDNVVVAPGTYLEAVRPTGTSGSSTSWRCSRNGAAPATATSTAAASGSRTSSICSPTGGRACPL